MIRRIGLLWQVHGAVEPGTLDGAANQMVVYRIIFSAIVPLLALAGPARSFSGARTVATVVFTQPAWAEIDVNVARDRVLIEESMAAKSFGTSLAFGIFESVGSRSWSGGWNVGRIGGVAALHVSAADPVGGTELQLPSVDVMERSSSSEELTFVSSGTIDRGFHRLLLVGGTDGDFKGTFTVRAGSGLRVASVRRGTSTLVTQTGFRGTNIALDVGDGLGPHVARGATYSADIFRTMFGIYWSSGELVGSSALSYVDPRGRSTTCEDSCKLLAQPSGQYKFTLEMSQPTGASVILMLADVP